MIPHMRAIFKDFFDFYPAPRNFLPDFAKEKPPQKIAAAEKYFYMSGESDRNPQCGISCGNADSV